MKVKSFTINTDNAKDLRDCYFSNGQRYLVPQDRGYTDSSQEEYHSGFSDHDRLLDNAIERGKDLHLGCNLWRIYDDAVDNYGLCPLDPPTTGYLSTPHCPSGRLLSVSHKTGFC